MTRILYAITEARHPEEAAKAAVSKDARALVQPQS
jgi:hypothetical protein